MKNIFLTLTGYQITWLCCVFGEYYNFSFLGLIVGIFYLCIFFYFMDFKIRALKICFIFSLIGYFFDSFLGYCELFNVVSSFILLGYIASALVVIRITIIGINYIRSNFLDDEEKSERDEKIKHKK